MFANCFSMNRFEVYAGFNDHPESSAEHFIKSFHDKNEAKQYAIQLFKNPPWDQYADDAISNELQWVHVYDTQEAKIILQRYS